MAWSAIVTKKEIKAPRVKLPPNDTTKEACKTRNKANPASVAIKAGGVASINPVKNGADTPNIIAKRQMTMAAVYCWCFSPLLDNIAFTGPVRQVDTAPNRAVIIEVPPQTAVIVLTGGL